MRWLRIGLLVVGLFAVVPPVLAQTKDENKKALTLGHDGLAAYNKGDWAEARAKFAEADRLAHSPVFVLYLARSARNAGDLTAAKEAYDRLVMEVVPPGAPAPWAAAVASAKLERAELEKKLAELAAAAPTSTASAAPTVVPTTTAVPTAAAVPTTAAAPGLSGTAAPTSTAPFPTATTASPSNTAVPPGGPAQGEPGSIVPGVSVVALGAVGLGVGIGLFVHAKSMADGVLERCAGKALCPAEDQAVRDSAIGVADGATAALAVGGALLATGAVLLVIRPGGKPASCESGARRAAGVGVDPGVRVFLNTC